MPQIRRIVCWDFVIQIKSSFILPCQFSIYSVKNFWNPTIPYRNIFLLSYNWNWIARIYFFPKVLIALKIFDLFPQKFSAASVWINMEWVVENNLMEKSSENFGECLCRNKHYFFETKRCYVTCIFICIFWKFWHVFSVSDFIQTF